MKNNNELYKINDKKDSNKTFEVLWKSWRCLSKKQIAKALKMGFSASALVL
jgi:hypothetical protein